MVGAQRHPERDDRRLRRGRPRLASAGVLREDGKRAPVAERRGRAGSGRDVLVERAQALNGRSGGLKPGGTSACSRRDGCRDLGGSHLSAEEREDDRLGRRLRHRRLARLRGDGRAGATEADDRAVGRVLERLHLRVRADRPGEIAERHVVLAGDRDPEDECARPGDGAPRWRRCRGERRGTDEDRACKREEADHHGASG